MKPEIKQKWVSALRSGEYEQATGVLHYDGKFCCLGVLCDIHAKETGSGSWKRDTSVSLAYTCELDERGSDCSDIGLTRAVCNWAGIQAASPIVAFSNKEFHLSNLNDGAYDSRARIDAARLTFNEIADLIEAQF